MRKLILVAVAGTAFALAGCSKSEAPEATETATEVAAEASDAASEPAADASADAAAPAADASEAAKM